jgi:hypothetical protein
MGLPDWGWHLKDFKSECLKSVSETFMWNLLRTSNFALLPAWIALEATREQFWRDHAQSADDSAEEEARKMDEFVRSWRSMPKEKLQQLIDRVGIEFIESHLTWSNGTALGIDTVFSSIIIDSWTSFETLAAVLWATTLDNDKTGHIQSAVDQSGALRSPKKKQTRPTFSLKTHPGAFWLETRRAVFQRLE